MAKFTLTSDERRVITTWLFEGKGSDTAPGYLDSECVTCKMSPRGERSKDPDLDIEQFCRDHKDHGWNLTVKGVTDRWDRGGFECGMVWWIRKNDGVDVSRADLPAEKDDWLSYLKDWEDSLKSNDHKATVRWRNANLAADPCVDESGDADGSIPSGDQRELQKSMITKALSVLEQ
ncbi:MAG: hypothetical protein LN413_00285 [Candidatus Thermoplasmatota archaeon]|nr:hypothetical protein [Candidatus Thermoplasmatota archaeon]